jgi:hypothetical protein
MKFERKNYYGTIRYYPRDDDARLLVSIFKHPPARTLSHVQVCVLNQLGMDIELVGDQHAIGAFEQLKINRIR